MRIVDQIPGASLLAGTRYWNFKVPVYAKLVDPPHATDETRAACLSAIFAAAEAIERSPRRPAGSRIACLVTTPFLFESEVTIFVDEDYFASFLPVKAPSRTSYNGGWVEASPTAPEQLGDGFSSIPRAPSGLTFFGGTKLVESDPDWDAPIERINWVWAFPRR